MTKYISVDAVVAINESLGGHVGVRDLGSVEGAVNRPLAGFGGHEEFPSLWAKAAVLLEGLARTQGFHDGNKRTAWLATDVFLEANGWPLMQMPEIVAEVFVLSAATGAIEHHQISEWIRHHVFAPESVRVLPFGEGHAIAAYSADVRLAQQINFVRGPDHIELYAIGVKVDASSASKDRQHNGEVLASFSMDCDGFVHVFSELVEQVKASNDEQSSE
ncbi:type II toxin-antitoxin system death-on-curing family toxin [Phytoactinopolyspora limicola]|uniref:type II toxin-antitoxin system death-on-curing family toxin n=1 Tax=Phytoactinopolyspora limicola TaxID=2715536 RepID=UPI00140CA604|nr:Fic family protein [Phytoactinopolyspora limicola]